MRYHHYEKAQYESENDKDPMYYFYPGACERFAFKINRVNGEFRKEELIEELSSSFTKIKLLIEERDGINSEEDNVVSIYNDLKLKVKEYLISENLL